jgi:hypothetical protein
MESFTHLFSSDFMPHGTCYLWDPHILWLRVVRAIVITVSYYCIPIHLILKQPHRLFRRAFCAFGMFIMDCGSIHLKRWNVWHGDFLITGIVKPVTAAFCSLTAAIVVRVVRSVISLPGRRT